MELDADLPRLTLPAYARRARPSSDRDLRGCARVCPPHRGRGCHQPLIDDLLTKTDSKYKLVLYSAKRARQINAYYSQLGEGALLEYVGPLVDTHVQEKPLSIALREINDDLLTCEDVDPAELAAEEAAAKAAAADASERRDRP
jgi:DNA-directed RNA polymerase subunit omega